MIARGVIARGVVARGVVAAAGAGLLLASCSSGGPADEPTSSTTRSRSLTETTAAAYARSTTRTVFGDPAQLDVCAIAANADLRRAGGITLAAPAVADAAGCTLTERPAAGTTSPAGRTSTVTVTLQTQPPPTTGSYARKVRTVSVQGGTLVTYAHDASSDSCPSALGLPRRGVPTTWVTVANAGTPAGRTSAQACAVSAQIAARFAAFAVRPASQPRLDVAAPSVTSIEACRVVAAARIAVTADVVTRTAYGTGCTIADAAGSVELRSGVLRGTASPGGSARTVDGHRLLLLPSDAPVCSVLSRQGDEVVTARFVGAGDSAPADCGPAADALTAYLDELGVT